MYKVTGSQQDRRTSGEVNKVTEEHRDRRTPGEAKTTPAGLQTQASRMKVEGKAALVTGGSQGLGKGIVKILLHHGAKVSVHCVGMVILILFL